MLPAPSSWSSPQPRIRRTVGLVRVGLALAAALAATGFAGPASIISTPPVLAADPGLTVVGAARYEAQPDAGRVLVTADLTATNRLVDKGTTKYFYDRAYLAVPPGASSFTVSGGLGRSNWTISEEKPTYTLLSITFGGRLGAGASTKLRLTFELDDPGNPPDRDVRVSRTLITFPVWALASTGTPGSSVTISIPADYTVTFLRGSIAGPTTDPTGNQVWTSGPIADPLMLDLSVRAERPPAYVDAPGSVTVGDGKASLTFRAWIDDSAWSSRMEDLYAKGLPRLAAAIGRLWPLGDPLTVQEALNPPAQGIAGSFDPANHRIEVIYSAGPEAALHEAAHAWFNGGFLADRWANEAFASYYAELVAGELGLPTAPAVITPQLRAAAVPLNAWAAGDAEPPAGADRSAVEAYGYAASAEVAREIAAQIGPAGLQRVWTAIGNGIAPYQPPKGPTEPLGGPPDWRGLLDLLEDDGTTHLSGLWAVTVIRPEEASMLAARTVARREYASVLARAGDWQLPRTIRDAMRSWSFDAAQQQLAIASTTLDERDALTAAAAKAGLPMPATLQRMFEGATDLAPVEATVKAETEAAAAIWAAMQARPAAIGPVEWIGLLGARPDQSLQGAVAAFGSADPATATADAAQAEASWSSATDAGRVRLVVGLAAVVAVVLLGIIVRFLRSRRSRA